MGVFVPVVVECVCGHICVWVDVDRAVVQGGVHRCVGLGGVVTYSRYSGKCLIQFDGYVVELIYIFHHLVFLFDAFFGLVQAEFVPTFEKPKLVGLPAEEVGVDAGEERGATGQQYGCDLHWRRVDVGALMVGIWAVGEI